MLSQVLLDELIDRALREDLGAGDVTTDSTVEPDTRARASAVARANLVVCGGAVFTRVFERADRSVRSKLERADGERAAIGDVLWTVEGPAQALLAGERVALNFAQRMSGVATITRSFVDALPSGSRARIADTRKTTPGLRLIERYAVRTGGGHNHRNDLGSAVLIKDNHIVAAGTLERAIARARERAPHTSRIEIEVQSLDELDRALAAGADIVLLDNFTLEQLREAVRRTAGRAVLEASGGVRLDRIGDIARTGVDVISIGALTHSAPAVDIGLDLELVRS